MKNSYKAFFSVCFLYFWLFIPYAQAAHKGPYIGIQLGWGDVQQGKLLTSTFASLYGKVGERLANKYSRYLFNDTGAAGRIFVGYQFNRYFAIESGYTHFNTEQTNLKMYGDLNILNRWDLPLGIETKATVKTYAFDFVGKGILPVSDKFSLYGKLGLAYLNSDGRININTNTPIGSLNFEAKRSINLMYPTYGLGINYDLTQHASVDLSWNRIQRVHSIPYPSTDFISAGLLYHFD